MENNSSPEAGRTVSFFTILAGGSLVLATVIGPCVRDLWDRGGRVFFESGNVGQSTNDTVTGTPDTTASGESVTTITIQLDPETAPDDAPTTPADKVKCTSDGAVDLSFTDEELAAALLRDNRPALGVLADCPGQTFSFTGEDAAVGGMEAYRCKALRPNFPITERETGQFLLGCLELENVG